MADKRLIYLEDINAEHLSYESAGNIRQYLKGYKTVDVESLPIVQELREKLANICYCKDCIKWNTIDCPMMNHYHDEIPEDPTDPEDFCSYGERKKNNARNFIPW